MTPINKENKFKDFVNKTIDFPLWIKQVLFLALRDNLEGTVTKSFLNIMAKENTFQFFIPKLTFKGKKELETREHNLDINTYKFLSAAVNEISITEITIGNFWTLEECAKCFTDALDLEYIHKPANDILTGTAYYISGKIRLGEYFTRIGRLTIDQLDEALRAQKQISESTGDRIGIAGVMLNLGFVSEKDIQSILHVKDESKKRFIFDMTIPGVSAPGSSSDEQDGLSNTMLELEKLRKENKILKEQLRKILNIGKKP